MKKTVLLLFFTLVLSFKSFSQVNVTGYYRNNGTYVVPHMRSNPDGNPYNNYSFPGNINPYTGKIASGNEETYLRNYYNKSNGKSNSYSQVGFMYLQNNEKKKAKENFIRGIKYESYNEIDKQVQVLMIAHLSVYDNEYSSAENYLNKIQTTAYDDKFTEDLGYLYYNIFNHSGSKSSLVKARYFLEKVYLNAQDNCSVPAILLFIYHYFRDDISFNETAEKAEGCYLDLRFHTEPSGELIKIKEMFKLGIITEEEYNLQIKKLKIQND